MAAIIDKTKPLCTNGTVVTALKWTRFINVFPDNPIWFRAGSLAIYSATSCLFVACSGGKDDVRINHTDTGNDTFTATSEKCFDWEDRKLDDAGYPNVDEIDLWDGAVVFNIHEGQYFSDLIGEEQIELNDNRAVMMRSSAEGDPTSISIITTPYFEVTNTQLYWWQISEVGPTGVEIYADLINRDNIIVASIDIPVETGGYIPALDDSMEPIPGFEEISYGHATIGKLVAQVSDVSVFRGDELKLRIYQHTKQEGFGFFTIFDDICIGESSSEQTLDWEPPNPNH